jgi:hypothetical protein
VVRGSALGYRGGDVLLEVAGSALSEVNFQVLAVEGCCRGDEPGGVGVDDLCGLAVT